MDETRHGGDEVNIEDETVMDEAQGSSMLHQGSVGSLANMLTSALTHHIATATRRRPQSSDIAHLHSRTAVHARAYYKVCWRKYTPYE